MSDKLHHLLNAQLRELGLEGLPMSDSEAWQNFLRTLEKVCCRTDSEALHQSIVNTLPDLIWFKDTSGTYLTCNMMFAKLMGVPQTDILYKTNYDFLSKEQADAIAELDTGAIENGEPTRTEEWAIFASNGQRALLEITRTPMHGDSGELIGVLGVARDITQQKQSEKLIWRQANFDELTSLPNRQMFLDRLEQEAKKSQRGGRPLALLLIDLDRFKEVNDSLGHQWGDALLMDAAQRITGCVRDSDTVARLGGDEFVVIIPDLNDLGNIERIATNIIAKLSAPFSLGSNEAYISASIGIAFYPNDSDDMDDLLRNADQAMYAAKSAGRKRYCYFTPEMQEAAQKRLHLANDLRMALSTGQLRLYYQPIVDLATGKIHKAEALIRWLHPERGMISPMEFISLAEETGLIIPIGDWVFKQAAEQAKLWRQRHPAFQVSVNISPMQFHYSGRDNLAWPEHLREQSLHGQSIVGEITESLLVHAKVEVNKKLLQFRDAGIQVAIDDFGTGYSSLAYLKEFDIDYLKIDKSFINNLATGKSERALCEAIIIMAHKLGFKVIAEGVETAEQRDLLLAAGCDFAQGYLYSKPVPPGEFEKFLPAT